jgi:hypothetical protein
MTTSSPEALWVVTVVHPDKSDRAVTNPVTGRSGRTGIMQGLQIIYESYNEVVWFEGYSVSLS